jgi:brefeldin A-inhibited guanine nucleotide-exchange protein
LLVRNAFVTALSTFTLLKNAREMKQKNIDCIKALLALAHSEGNYLKGTWRVVLDCCSQLNHLQVCPLFPPHPSASD